MLRDWNILVVDDEEDVHTATQLALKYSRWQGRRFKLISAFSGQEATRLLDSPDADTIDVALIDVVMETNEAGLELCRLIRAKLPRTLRIILRTGQAGVAPEDRVLNDYDIDYYLSKADVTQQRLYATIRACLRSSQDIATILAVDTQLRGLVEVLKQAGSLNDMLPIMTTGLKFLESKHGVRTIFITDTTNSLHHAYSHPLLGDRRSEAFERARAAIAKAHEQKLEAATLHPGTTVGLGPKTYIYPLVVFQDPEQAPGARRGGFARFSRWLRGALPTAWEPIRGGLYVEFRDDASASAPADFQYDASLFLKNWNLAFTTLQLQENVARQRALSAEAFWHLEPGAQK